MLNLSRVNKSISSAVKEILTDKREITATSEIFFSFDKCFDKGNLTGLGLDLE